MKKFSLFSTYSQSIDHAEDDQKLAINPWVLLLLFCFDHIEKIFRFVLSQGGQRPLKSLKNLWIGKGPRNYPLSTLTLESAPEKSWKSPNEFYYEKPSQLKRTVIMYISWLFVLQVPCWYIYIYIDEISGYFKNLFLIIFFPLKQTQSKICNTWYA